MGPTQLEIKAIKAMESIVGDKYTLQPADFVIYQFGYITSFKLSNGEEYIVKIYDDNSNPKIFKRL